MCFVCWRSHCSHIELLLPISLPNLVDLVNLRTKQNCVILGLKYFGEPQIYTPHTKPRISSAESYTKELHNHCRKGQCTHIVLSQVGGIVERETRI